MEQSERGTNSALGNFRSDGGQTHKQLQSGGWVGPSSLLGLVWEALAEGRALRKAKKPTGPRAGKADGNQSPSTLKPSAIERESATQREKAISPMLQHQCWDGTLLVLSRDG